MSGQEHEDLIGLLPRLTAFARALLREPDTAADIVQEAVSRALSARRVPRDRPAYRAWLFTIVRNAALDEFRRRKRPEPEAGAAIDLWRFDDDRIARITIAQGLSTLPAHHREIIGLIDIAGFGYGEAADILDVPVGTVMSRITRARGALLAAIDRSTVRPLKTKHGR
jgi:RNA polymerase sigma-70 factor (ECF subfamily)